MTDDLDHIQENVPYRELVPFADAIYSDRAMRESNEKMRQEFTANVSHELKTPLTSISGYAEMIETGLARPEDVASFGQKIHSEASRMLRLVNDIIQLSHLDASGSTRNVPVMEPVDLAVIARECAERLKVNARRAYVTLNCRGGQRPGDGLPQLAGRNCAKNLCDKRHPLQTSRGAGSCWRPAAPGRATPTFRCRTTASGIPKEAQSSVFERFYRVDKSRSKATGGTGLGPGYRQADRTHPQRTHPAEQRGGGGHHRHHHL